MVKVYVNNIPVEVHPGTRILHAATKAGFHIPTLCYHQDLEPSSSCGICMVEANGRIIRACSTPVEPDMKIITDSKKLLDLRRNALKIILMSHPNNCPECVKNGRCELQKICQQLGITDIGVKPILKPDCKKDTSSPSITLDPVYCIQCGRCITVCNDIQDVHALEYSKRGFYTKVGPSFNKTLQNSECVKCGQCSAHCPVAAIYEADDSEAIWEAIDNPEKVVVVQEAPAVRVALGEEFGMPVGTNVVGKMYTALRRLGCNYIFDTNFGADLTIMEEASELKDILLNKPEELPLVTSCCPAWVDFMEKFYVDLIPHFSTAKSPHQMVGTMVKTYWAQKMGIDPKNIFLVSVMPCTAKKYEIERMEDMYASGFKDVDVTITTRELAKMIKMKGIDFTALPDGVADNPMGEYSGAGTIFGASGGVMEAALRTGYYLVTGEDMPDPKIDFVRGHKGIKVGEINIAGKTLKIAVASGLANVSIILNQIREDKAAGRELSYHFIEVMACRNGCVGGGGQPYGSTNQIRHQRALGLYTEDEGLKFRHSHHNPSIIKLYDEFLDKPNSHKAHKLLHTSYIARPVRNK